MVSFASATVEDITKSFPTHDVIPLIKQPTYATLKPMMEGLKTCAKAIPSVQAKGHFYLVVSDVEFLRVTTHAKVTPTRPPANPVIAAGATQFQIAQANRDHDRCEKSR